MYGIDPLAEIKEKVDRIDKQSFETLPNNIDSLKNKLNDRIDDIDDPNWFSSKINNVLKPDPSAWFTSNLQSKFGGKNPGDWFVALFNEKFSPAFTGKFPDAFKGAFPDALKAQLGNKTPVDWFAAQLTSSFPNALKAQLDNKDPAAWFSGKLKSGFPAELKSQLGNKDPTKWFNDTFISQFDSVFPVKLEQQLSSVINKALPSLYGGKSGMEAFKLGFSDLASITKDPSAWIKNITDKALPNVYGSKAGFDGIKLGFSDLASITKDPKAWIDSKVFGGKTPDVWFNGLFPSALNGILKPDPVAWLKSEMDKLSPAQFIKTNANPLLTWQKQFNSLGKPFDDIKSKIDENNKIANKLHSQFLELSKKTYRYGGYNIMNVIYDRDSFSVTDMFSYMDRVGGKVEDRIKNNQWIDAALTSAVAMGAIWKDMAAMLKGIKEININLQNSLSDISKLIEDLKSGCPPVPKELPGIFKP